jgi:AcrR family transcriptional regulator
MGRPRSDIGPRIVHAARHRFLKEGVDGASLRMIARDAKTSIGMVYYYFPTKDDLFFAVIEEVYQKILADMTTALADDAPVRERIRRVYERVGALSKLELSVVQLIAREVLVSSNRLDRLFARFQKGHIPMIVQTLVEGVQNGTIDPGVTPAVLFLSTVAVGAVPQVMRRVIGKRLPLPGLEDESFVDQLVDVLFRGIGAREGTDKSGGESVVKRPP